MRNHPGVLEEEGTPVENASEGVSIRQAQLADVPAILRLINGYAAKKIMLPRNEMELCESVRDFVVAVDRGRLIGCGALHFYTPQMAELRSLAVSPEQTRSGLGARIAQELLEQARQFGVQVVFAFTYVPHFFEKVGFRSVDRAMLPMKAWKDCLKCPMFHACDEVAMAFFITPAGEIYMSEQPPEEANIEGPLVMPKLGTPRVLDES